MTEENFNLEEKLSQMESVPGSHLDIVATYIRTKMESKVKPFKVENKKQLELIIRSNVKWAKDLTAFTPKQIQKVMDDLETDFAYRIKNKGLENNWEWKLSTVLKKLV